MDGIKPCGHGWHFGGPCKGEGLVAGSHAHMADESAGAQRQQRAAADCSAEPQSADEEMEPHAFNSRTPYEPGDDRDIWCKDCEYHRDHIIHVPQAVGVDGGASGAPEAEQPGKPSRNVSSDDQPSPETKGSER